MQDAKEKVLLCERLVLQTLAFDLRVAQPYKPLVDKVRAARDYMHSNKEEEKEFLQLAINFLNDRYTAEILINSVDGAAACAQLFVWSTTLFISRIARCSLRSS
jgi:hypothetical protein